MKFRVGDKVRVINGDEYHAKDTIHHIVSGAYNNDECLRLDSGWYVPVSELELIENAPAREYSTVTLADTFPKSGGVKYDQGKPDLSMIPYEALEEIAKVLMFGASKYDKNNWKKGINSTRLAGAALRHLGKWCDGIDVDSESNLSHLSHAATNLLMLIWTMKNKPEVDDRE